MEKTQRLMSIALAVLALDGCRGGSTQQAAAPSPSGSPTPSTVGTHSGYRHYGGSHVGSFAAGAAVGGALGGDRRYPPGYAQRGYGNTATVDRTLGGNRNRGAAAANNGVRTGGTSYGSRTSFFGRFFGGGGGFGGFGARGFGG